MSLRISTLQKEGVYQGSKFLKHYILCEREDLKLLFDELKPFSMYPLTNLSDGSEIDQEAFLKSYESWIEKLKTGKTPEDQELKKMLACVITRDTNALWKQKIPGKRYLIKMRAPCVQVQAHTFTYSDLDGAFRPMTMGKNQIFWGLCFSFPQIYQKPKTMQLSEVEEGLNSELFQTIKLWVRNTSRATPFIVNGKKTNAPIRLGKSCFSWINSHPELKRQNIAVREA